MPNPTTVRFNELEQALLETLALGASQADILREGLRLVWEHQGQAALSALDILKPDRANRVRQLIKSYQHDDPAWTRALWPIIEEGQ